LFNEDDSSNKIPITAAFMRCTGARDPCEPQEALPALSGGEADDAHARRPRPADYAQTINQTWAQEVAMAMAAFGKKIEAQRPPVKTARCSR
jgi:hypothetical protein